MSIFKNPFTSKKLFALLPLAALLLIAAACSESNSVAIKGETADKREMTLRFVTYTPAGVRSEVIATPSGKFEYSLPLGNTDLPAYIEVYSNDYTLLGLASARKGDELVMTVDANGLAGFKLSQKNDDGHDSFNETLNEWLATVKHIDNDAIARFVTANKDNPAAYAVFSTLFNARVEPSEAKKLYSLLSDRARPAYYNNGFATMLDKALVAPSHIAPDTLLCAADSMTVINPKDHKASFIAFVLNDHMRTDSVIHTLQQFGKQAARKNLLVLEHNLCDDTTMWRRSHRGDLSQIKVRQRQQQDTKIKNEDQRTYWTSVWTGPGVGAPFADQFNITALPFFVVADSTARIVYSGTSLAKASALFSELF